MSTRDVHRTQNLLRRLDLEEVLADLDLVIAYRNGADAYFECPDPSHRENNPSFHVCVEDVTDADGESHLGYFNCWSHPGEPLKGLDFLDLVARIRGNVWDRGSRNSERIEAAKWLRSEYLLNGEDPLGDLQLTEALGRRERGFRAPDYKVLTFPPNVPVSQARPEFRRYLENREISAERALELDLRAVSSVGDLGYLSKTIPGVLFPIRDGGRVINWYVRSIYRVPSKQKGRYCSGLPFVKDAGVMWLTGDRVDRDSPVALVEGIFDAERVRAVLLRNPGASPVPPGNVVAVLGGRVYPSQARRLSGVKAVIHLADGDEGGKNLWRTVKEHLSHWTHVEARTLPDGTDPGDAPEDVILEALQFSGDVGRRGKMTVRYRGRRMS
jgi:hypothetical protein